MFETEEVKIKDLKPGDKITLFGLDQLRVVELIVHSGDFVWLVADQGILAGENTLDIRVDGNLKANKIK